MNQNETMFLEVLKTTFPDIYIIHDLIGRGHLTPQEVAEVVHKMAIVRTSDDGYGKIVIELQNKEGERFLRIRTIQDKVLRTLPEEDI